MAQDRSERKTKRRPYLGLYVKLYISSLDDIKIRQMDADTRCFWIDVLLLAKAERGVLPQPREIAFRLRMQEAEAKSRMMALVSLGLVDEDHISGGVVWSVHAWDKWQGDSISTPRVRRHRERLKANETLVKRKRNVSRNANETLETNSNSTYLSLDRYFACHERKLDSSEGTYGDDDGSGGAA